MNNILKSALDYRAKGFSVIPMSYHKKPIFLWKEYQSRLASVEEIEEWVEKNPKMNLAIVTGKVSGIVVIDIEKGGDSSGYPSTVTAKTGGGGVHLYYKHPGYEVPSGTRVRELTDIRGDGGCIIVPPSVSYKGEYEWVISPDDSDFSDLPDWVLKKTTPKEADKKWLRGKNGVSEGSRNDTSASMAGKIISSTDPDLLESIGWEQFKVWNDKNTPPLNEKELRGIWESIKKYNNDTNKGNDMSLLHEICSQEDVTLFHNEQNDAYIALDILGHREVWPCDGSALKNLLAFKNWERSKKPLGSEASKSMIAVLEGKACFEGPEIKLHNRVAWYENNLWYDLSNKTWQFVKINEKGWEVIDKPPIIFNRHSHHQAQVIPVQNGNIELFLNYINITNSEHKLLLLVFMVSCFVPDFPHVMLVVFGAQGSSKSTFFKLKRMVTDPSIIDVVAMPEKQNELVQVLAHHHCLLFDNVSHISEDTSDTLCRAITGSGFSKRKLYKNDEDLIYKFHRCVGINGINLVTIRPDLLERSLLIELERIDSKERKHEKEIYENFAKDLPSILGGVFDVLVNALKIKPQIKISSLPRMADWALWGCAISEALGYSKEEFLSAYENNINRQAEMLLNENIVATTLFSFMEDKEEWRGTMTALLEALYTKTPTDYFAVHEKYWPKGASALSRRLNELSTYLKQLGILVVISTSGTERYIDIKNMNKTKEEVEKTPEQLALNDNSYGIDGIIPKPKEDDDFEADPFKVRSFKTTI
jgi:hypothetical protein